MKRRNFISSLWCLILFFTGSAGCAVRQKNVTDLPPGVTQTQVQNWDTAVATFDRIAQTVSTLRQSVILLNQTMVTDSTGTHKVFPDGDAYVKVLTSIGRIDQAEIDASAFLKAQPQNWSAPAQTKVKNEIAIIQQEILALNQQGLVGIKSESAQAQVQQLVASVGTSALLILSLIY